MKARIKIRRFNPETDRKPYWAEYRLDAEPWDRVLDVLVKIKDYQDGTLTFRRSCAHGICGSDVMVINGHNRLACKVLMKDVGARVTIEPLRGLPVIKDLTVDMAPFFAHYRSIQPFLINDDPPPYTERLQSPEARARFDDTTKCILCAACTTSCPSFWANDSYVGPAAIVQAHRFIFDDRDHGAQVRLAILSDADGVWRCRTIYNCVEACPRDIDITRAIGEVKKTLLLGKTA
ncbi:MAG: succinate dehydrogenase iron-sulfur subunit [Chloroflexi bacterium HGW-Chloroflexi-1]|nr:MAG: succinate dehydrogenase iron-sulfur subunit [Chloroflexi bacterium HGW-Chloroflexi-1]